MIAEQMYFWEKEVPTFMSVEIRTMVKSQDNVRKGLFKRHGQLKSQIESLYKEFNQLKNYITKENVI